VRQTNRQSNNPHKVNDVGVAVRLAMREFGAGRQEANYSNQRLGQGYGARAAGIAHRWLAPSPSSGMAGRFKR
jgi:hypothetical protein